MSGSITLGDLLSQQQMDQLLELIRTKGRDAMSAEFLEGVNAILEPSRQALFEKGLIQEYVAYWIVHYTDRMIRLMLLNN